jgi:hypothetical protein
MAKDTEGIEPFEQDFYSKGEVQTTAKDGNSFGDESKVEPKGPSEPISGPARDVD